MLIRLFGPSCGLAWRVLGLVLALGCSGRPMAEAAESPAGAAPNAVVGSDSAPERGPLLQLGPGDTVSVQVYGQPDMSAVLYISDDGTIPVPLAGAVMVGGLSPAQAGAQIEKAFRDRNILVDPHVTITVTQSRSQRVSVLGQVGTPGRYPIDSDTTIFDVLSLAGGVTPTGADVIFLLHTGPDGQVVRTPIDLRSLANGKALPLQPLKGGDSVFVPIAEQFYIYGEVMQPGKFRIEPGMTVIQAIARAGGITVRGSQRRVEVKRKLADGSYVTSKAKLSDLVQAEDVIRVKESIF